MTAKCDMLNVADICHVRVGIYAHGAEIFVHRVGQAARLHPTDR